MQTRAGERDVATRNGRIVSDVIPERARTFLERQRMVIVGHADANVWASILFGDLGFVSTTDGTVVHLVHGLPVGDPIGLLAIDFVSRIRLRVNGVTESAGRIRVREAYPNCPKYLQRRVLSEKAPVDRGGLEQGSALDGTRIESIRRADTAFVASRHPERGMDASHRGGNPGFLRVDGDTLVVPDYSGNGMFNSLGNFLVDPAAGMTVLDFDRGRILEMTGDAEIALDLDEERGTGGTGRWWKLHVRAWRELPVPSTFHWDLRDPSPFNP